MTRVGLDGLTTESLRASREAWWDRRFTDLLVEVAGPETRRIVEVGCGLGRAAEALLPRLGSATYCGIDLDLDRLRAAASALASPDWARRTVFLRATAGVLPIADETADVVLTVMTIQHLPDPRVALAEGARILRSGGRFVAAEPDNLGQRFYFDGVLEEVTSAIKTLTRRARLARKPADIALGPRLPRLLQEVGLRVEVVVHAVHTVRYETPDAWFDRLHRMVATVAQAAGLAMDIREIAACEQALQRARAAAETACAGFSAQVVPVFVSVGHKN